MGKITKISEHVDQACRVYGEEWRDILFKKWTFFENIYPEDSHVYLIIKVAPSVNKKLLYNTKKEATEALIIKQNERLREVMERKNWTQLQGDTYWVRGLENDLHSSASKVKIE